MLKLKYELPKSDQEMLEEMLLLADEKRVLEGNKLISKELKEQNDEEEEVKVQVDEITLDKQNL